MDKRKLAVDNRFTFHLLVSFFQMPTLRTLLTITAILFFLGSDALAQDGSTASQMVTLEVKPVTKISVSGDPGTLIIADALPGVEKSSVSDENSTYSITTNLESMKIVASINAPMPSGTRLMLALNSSKAISSGVVDISSALTSVNVVTGIGKTSEHNQTIRYTFEAGAEAGEIETDSRIITLTLTN